MQKIFVRAVACLVLAVPMTASAQQAVDPAAAPPPGAATTASPNDSFENEFKAFREKMQTAKAEAEGSAPAASDAAAKPATALPAGIAPAANNVPTPPATQAQPELNPLNGQPVGGASPLGPAANLPVGGNLPPGAYAMTPQTQQEMQEQMEAQQAEQQKKLQEQAFDSALKELMPLKPTQIRKTLESFKESREAAETPIADPEPKQVVQTVPLDPSAAPTTIMLAPGNVTTLTILDSTGAPWPIQDVSWAGKFDVTPPEDGGHVIRITPASAHGVGNISIRLVDLVTPVTMSLKTNLDEVYYRFDARIPKQGPLAKPSIIEYGGLKATAGADGAMDQILDGTAPDGARKMTLDGADGRTTAWKVEDKIYIRTPLTLLSPGWDASISSADGMNVYNLARAPVILLSDQGRMVRVRLTEDEVLP